MSKRIALITHAEEFGPGALTTLLDQEKHQVTTYAAYEKPSFPEVNDCDAWIVLGGSQMLADERKLPWFSLEKDYLATVVDSGKPVLGLGLGANILSELLGAEATALETPELGVFPITLTPEAQALGLGTAAAVSALHWRYEATALPEGAVKLANSASGQCQGYRYGSVWAFACHLEADSEWIARVLKKHRSDLKTPSETIQAQDVIASTPVEGSALLSQVLKALWVPPAAAPEGPAPSSEPNGTDTPKAERL